MVHISSPRDAFAQARLYLCTDSRQRQGDLPDFLDAAYAGGVDVIQLREKGLEARAELRFLAILADVARRHGKLWAVNDRADVALAAGAPVLHLGQDDLPAPIARRIVGESVVIGRSTHSPAQFDQGYAEPGVDYVCAGPTWATPTKPGRPAAGVSLLSHAAAVDTIASAAVHAATATPVGGGVRPWFAIGGIENLARLDEVIAAGARRVVVVRAITEADDPEAAARAFATRLAASGPMAAG